MQEVVRSENLTLLKASIIYQQVVKPYLSGAKDIQVYSGQE